MSAEALFQNRANNFPCSKLFVLLVNLVSIQVAEKESLLCFNTFSTQEKRLVGKKLLSTYVHL